MLPYGYFEGAKLTREAETDVLHLQFKANHFTMRGSALGELFSAFQTLSVEWLIESPRRYEMLAKGHAFIKKIELPDDKE